MSTFQLFSHAEVESLRIGGAILRDCLQHVASLVRSGVTTASLDSAAETFIRDRGGIPVFKGYHGFPATLCISVNEEVVHGIPGERVLKRGDIVSLDGGVLYDSLNTDACITVPVGEVDSEVSEFLACVSQTLEDVVRDVIRAGIPVGTLSSFIQDRIQKAGYSVVRELTGHGLGSQLHQYPDIPNFGVQGKGPLLPAGTLIAVEPIATNGKAGIKTLDDGWTICTKDRSLACHFEHTLLITKGGCEVIA